MNVSRIVVSIVVGIITWVVVAFAGLLIGRYLDGQIGSFVTNVAVLFGVLAAVWRYYTGTNLVE